jgi:tRNA (guanine37-N1)-methyltransferase
VNTALKIEVLTLFPEMVNAPLTQSLLGKARERGVLSVTVTDIRDNAAGKHRVTDDAPYGGGAGMVMKPEPLVASIEAARTRLPGAPVFLMSPQGARFDQGWAQRLSELESFVLVCGRYEGVDERVSAFVDGELSVGDFVLSGGELAALCIVDAVARLWPGVLGNEESTRVESFAPGSGLLEYPHYTRPVEFRGMRVPEILLSGDHAAVERWRAAQALQRTQDRRPDLLDRRNSERGVEEYR